METAHKRDAVSSQKFYFRKDPFSSRRSNGDSRSGTATPQQQQQQQETSRPQTPATLGPVEDEYELMTINEVINGQSKDDGGFPGLIPLVESYLNSMNVDVETRCDLARYLDLIRKRADGTYWTAARWIREFVRGHERYQCDSVVGEEITYDLVKVVEGITRREGSNGVGWEMLGKRRR